MDPESVIPLSFDGGRVLGAHQDRVVDAAIAGGISEVDLDTILAAVA